MTGLRVTVPFACWRVGWARQFRESEELPPPSTCYGFLLSLVGEYDRSRHAGARVSSSMLSRPNVSNVLRTMWRTKVKSLPQGQGSNMCPDYQQILSNIDIVVWVDDPGLEERVRSALLDPSSVMRSHPLCLGESGHIVDDVSLYMEDLPKSSRTMVLAPRGRYTVTTRVDLSDVFHADHAVCNLAYVERPTREDLPLIP